MKQFTATANDDGVRLSRFVQSVTRDFPTSLLYKSFRNKRVKVNGKKAAPEYRLQAGDLIELYINDEFFPPEGAKPASWLHPVLLLPLPMRQWGKLQKLVYPLFCLLGVGTSCASTWSRVAQLQDTFRHR